MNFTSIIFFIFLPITLLLYWLTPSKYKWITLLVASYFFYAYLNYWLIFLILGTTLISYLGARGIEKYQKHRKLILSSVLTICLGFLFVFKYLDFVLSTTSTIFSLCKLNISINPLNIILPVGISFYTFQTIGYVIDVYKGKINAEHHIGYFALFVSFFPQLVAGPIEPASKLIPELKKEHIFNMDNFSDGLKYVMSGFIKKVLIADFLVQYVNLIYGNLSTSGGGEILLATFLFGIVIYCDFSGYSEIALGLAKWMDINLTRNFDRPYLSSSFKEFWRRWHITLNNFFSEYIYIPLGGSKQGKIRKYAIIFLIFFLSGLWHGASLHFIIWGVICGIIYIVVDLLTPFLAKIKLPIQTKNMIGIFITYILVNLCWIFFRVQNINEIGIVFNHIFISFSSNFDTSFFTVINIILSVLSLIVLPLTYYLPVISNKSRHQYVYISIYVTLIIIVSLAYINNLSLHGESSFIYFQF